MQYDVAIIGGGITGSALAYELMRYRLNVTLLEKATEVGFGTSKSNSGVIHAGHHAPPNTLKGQLEWEGNQLWDKLAAELGFGFKRIGELTVALDASQIPVLEELERQGKERGVSGLEIWDQPRIRREEPNLNPNILAALYAPTTGVTNPYEVCFLLVENAIRNGLVVQCDTTVSAITKEGGCITLHTGHGEVRSRFVINAAGLFADQIAEMAGVPAFRISPRRGEEYLLDKRLAGLIERVIFPCPTPASKGILVIPTCDGTIMVGPTADPVDDKRDVSTTFAGAAEIFAAVNRLVPGISERDCIAEFAGLRAVADTEDFIIGASPLKGFINVAGIQSPGLTAAPAIARKVVRILGDEGLDLIPNETYIPNAPKPIHFSGLPTDEQILLCQRDPRYSQIVCRCECVGEGEIVDAIRRGARTLDGVKLRTRAGMGRCQGGFCTWRVMQLLARELNLPMTTLTKHGDGSWLICDREDAPCSPGS